MSTINPYGRLLALKSTAYSYIVDKNTSKILYINPPFLEKLGKNEEELLGCICHQVLFQATESCSFCPMMKMDLQERVSAYVYQEERDAHFMMYSHLMEQNETSCFVQSLVDISEEMEEIEHLKQLLQEEELVTACANTLQQRESAIEQLLELVCQFFQGNFGYILLKKRHPVGYRFDYIYSQEVAEDQFAELKTRTFPFDQKSMEMEEKLWNMDYLFLEGEALSHLPDYAQQIQTLGENSLFTLLTLGEEVLGLLVITDIQEKKEHLSVISAIKPYI